MCWSVGEREGKRKFLRGSVGVRIGKGGGGEGRGVRGVGRCEKVRWGGVEKCGGLIEIIILFGGIFGSLRSWVRYGGVWMEWGRSGKVYRVNVEKCVLVWREVRVDEERCGEMWGVRYNAWGECGGCGEA